MGKEHGIKETKEAILGAIVIGVFVAERLKDGVDFADAAALGNKLITDPDFRRTLDQAIEGIDMVDDEIEDISFEEAIELAGLIPEILKAFKKGSNKPSA